MIPAALLFGELDGLGSLADPVAVMPFRAPFDHRSPVIECYDEGWSFVDQRNGLVEIDCTISLVIATGADMAAGESSARRYMTAIIDVIRKNTKLDGVAVETILAEGSSAIAPGDRSNVRYVYSQGAEVRIYDEG